MPNLIVSTAIDTFMASANLSEMLVNIGLGNIENTALSTWAGSSNLTTLGTINTGVWNGSIIGSNYGGAGSVSGLLKANGSGVVSSAVSGTDYEVPITFSTGLTRTGNSVAVNSAQAITRLSNLSTNGFVTAGSGNGTLAVVASISLTSDVSGTLGRSNGGTGQTSYTDGQLLIGNSSGGLSKSTLSAGTGVSITNGNGSIIVATTTTRVWSGTIDISEDVNEYTITFGAGFSAPPSSLSFSILMPNANGEIFSVAADITTLSSTGVTIYLSGIPSAASVGGKINWSASQ